MNERKVNEARLRESLQALESLAYAVDEVFPTVEPMEVARSLRGVVRDLEVATGVQFYPRPAGDRQAIDRREALARAYLAALGAIMAGVDRLAGLYERGLDRARLDGELVRSLADDLRFALEQRDEERLRATLAPFVRADHLRRLSAAYRAPWPGDRDDDENPQDLQQWRAAILGEVGP